MKYQTNPNKGQYTTLLATIFPKYQEHEKQKGYELPQIWRILRSADDKMQYKISIDSWTRDRT